jgi:hypothetical protein
MKRNYTYILAYLFIVTAVFSSCQDDFLNITPKGQLIAAKTEDYDLMLNSLQTLGNQNIVATQSMGDELASYAPFLNGMTIRQQRSFRWEANIYEQGEDAPEIKSTMLSVYTYNVIIEEVGKSIEGSEKQKLQLEAEARGGRAWVYFKLINLFAAPYDASNAESTAGFPIVRQANVALNNFERASIKDVYEFILEDLKWAIPNLPATPIHRFRMSRPAAYKILGDVYLTMRRFQEAYENYNLAIQDVEKSTYPLEIYDYNKTFGQGGQFLPVTTIGPSYPNLYNNFESLYSRQVAGEWTVARNEILITPETVSLYSTNDKRLNFFSAIEYPNGAKFPLGMMRRNGPFSPIIGVLLPDLYLLRAETRARLDDLEGAKNDLEFLRRRRMPLNEALIPDMIAKDKITLLKFIFQERIREFAGLGYRWFDMRRLYQDPELKDQINFSHNVYGANGTIESSYKLNEARLTLRIPPKILLENPQMKDNQ